MRYIVFFFWTTYNRITNIRPECWNGLYILNQDIGRGDGNSLQYQSCWQPSCYLSQ